MHNEVKFAAQNRCGFVKRGANENRRVSGCIVWISVPKMKEPNATQTIVTF